jgi:hypothetical protein
MNEKPAVMEQAHSVLGLKESEQKKQRLDSILKNLIISAVNTGILDLTPYLVGGYLSAINDEVATANMMKRTILLKAIPDLRDDQIRKTLIDKRTVKVDVPKLTSESDDVSKIEDTVEVTLTYNLELFVTEGNKYHTKAKVDEFRLRAGSESVERVLGWVALPGDKVL